MPDVRPSEILIPHGYPNADTTNGAGMGQKDYADANLKTVPQLLKLKTFSMMQEECQRRHLAMWVACYMETGKRMGIGTGWRSWDTQMANWLRDPEQFSHPSTSYHLETPPDEKGLAVDNVSGDTWAWMHANTSRFFLIHLTANEQHHTQLAELPRSRGLYNRNPSGYWVKVQRRDLPYLGLMSIQEWYDHDWPITLDAKPPAPIPIPTPPILEDDDMPLYLGRLRDDPNTKNDERYHLRAGRPPGPAIVYRANENNRLKKLFDEGRAPEYFHPGTNERIESWAAIREFDETDLDLLVGYPDWELTLPDEG